MSLRKVLGRYISQGVAKLDCQRKQGTETQSKLLPTAPVLTAFAQASLMWSIASSGTRRRFHPDPVPFFQAIYHSSSIRLVKGWTADPITAFAPLMVYPSIILLKWKEPYGNGNLLARPSIGPAGRIFASKTAHDGGVIFFHAVVRVVSAIKVELSNRRFREDLQPDRDARDTWTTLFETLPAELASWIRKTKKRCNVTTV